VPTTGFISKPFTRIRSVHHEPLGPLQRDSEEKRARRRAVGMLEGMVTVVAVTCV
jgi:hypothetical protein